MKYLKKRRTFLPLAVPDLSRIEYGLVNESLRTGWISNGPKVRELEKVYAKWHGTKYAVALNSCTSALYLTLKSLSIKKGDRVIVPAMTWPSTANIVEQLGATTTFADIDERTLNIDCSHVDYLLRKYRGRVKAIIPVHMAGLPADITYFEMKEKKLNIPIIYDAAHAAFSYYRSQPAGSYGKASCFSLYATKNITAGDGGIVTTNDKKLADQIRLWSYHGLHKDSWRRYSRKGNPVHVSSVLPGYKMSMTDIQAAIAIGQIKRRKEFVSKRHALIRYYIELLKDTQSLELPVFKDKNGGWADHLFIVKVKGRVSRNRLMLDLKKYNIGTNVHFYPVHMHPYYKKMYPLVRLPVAEKVHKNILSLPLCTKYKKNDLRYVSDVLNRLLGCK